MTVIIISIIVAWIIFSALLAIIICVHTSRLSKGQEPFFDRAAWIKYMLEQEDKE